MPLPTPDYTASRSVEPQVREHQFLAGREREQVGKIRRKYSLVWNFRTKEVADQIESVFITSGGVNSFQYGLPGEPDSRWVAQQWNVTRTQGNFYTITCTLEEE